MCNRLPEIKKSGDAGIFPVYYSLKRFSRHSDTCGLFVGILYSKVSEISVWWSDFRLLQVFCKETQPDNLPAECIDCNLLYNVKKKNLYVAFLLCNPGWIVHILYNRKV